MLLQSKTHQQHRKAQTPSSKSSTRSEYPQQQRPHPYTPSTRRAQSSARESLPALSMTTAPELVFASALASAGSAGPFARRRPRIGRWCTAVVGRMRPQTSCAIARMKRLVATPWLMLYVLESTSIQVEEEKSCRLRALLTPVSRGYFWVPRPGRKTGWAEGYNRHALALVTASVRLYWAV